MATFTSKIDGKAVEIDTDNPTEIVTLTAQGWKREPDPEPADGEAKDPKPTTKPTTKTKPKTEVKAVEGGK